ncbi:potassium channel family protein [uncultured Tateyamaria sp.]|uniref:potassium channel family protein n=1 Tax=uncultured Tateyamaria sp. TaxID=455651 RepID=UPI0026109833|nr:potassium channel family protein [uncultured Tateyamaria sp.]
MSTTLQIIFGSTLLTLCALVHVGIVAASVPVYARLGRRLAHMRPLPRNTALLSVGVLLIVAAHTVQVWSWALAFHAVAAFEDFPTSFYFATVTYTTLGYGDLVLGDGMRIFGTFSAITGLLTFGVSTAFLINVIGRLLPALQAPHSD